MFGDCSQNTVGFTSIGKEERWTSDAYSQTPACSYQDASNQSRSFSSSGVQTEAIDYPNITQYNETNLCEFMKKVYPIMMKELNIRSPCIADIDDELSVFSGTTEKLFEIESPLKKIEDQLIRVSASEWNKDGTTLCIGYSYSHRDWCSHTSLVIIYYYDNLDESLARNPKKLEIPSCVKSLAFHPNLAILAIATFNGEIIICDTNKDKYSNEMSRLYKNYDRGHKDTINQISWIRNVDISEKQLMLATGGADGCIILWQYFPLKGELNLCAKLLLKSLGAHNMSHTNPVYSMLKMNFGVTCFSFSLTDTLAFVAGMENGEILKGALIYMPLKQSHRKLHIFEFCPVVGQYESHMSTVTDIKHVKQIGAELFVTSGLDRVIKVFDVRQDAPVHIFHTPDVVIGLLYFMMDENILLVWGSHKIYLYNIYTREVLKAPDFGSDSLNTAYSSLSSNRRCILATGHIHGKVSIWKLPKMIKQK